MLSEQKALALLTQEGIEIPPLELELLEVEPVLANGLRADWLIEIRWEGNVQRYAVEYKSPATPRNLQGAIDQVRRISEPSDDLLPMVMAPYLSENKLKLLADQRVSGIDLCGNAVVIAPGTWIVYRTGNPNRFPATVPIKNVYSGTSSLVGRALLSKGRFERLRDLQAAIEASGQTIGLGTISKVLSVLEDELIVSKRDGIRLIQPDALLDRLATGYKLNRPVKRIRGRFVKEAGLLADDDDLLQRITTWADESGAKLAISGQESYTGAASSDAYPPVYTDSARQLARRLGFEEVERFANAEIRETSDPLVYFDTHRDNGVSFQSPLQTYLELEQGGKRERELAALLRERILGAQA